MHAYCTVLPCSSPSLKASGLLYRTLTRLCVLMMKAGGSSVFNHCDNVPEINQLRKKRALTPSFRCSNPRSLGPVAWVCSDTLVHYHLALLLGPAARSRSWQDCMTEAAWLLYGSCGTERKELVPRYALQGHTLLLGPTL